MSLSRRERLETPRLICERLRDDHADELPQLLQDPRVARTLSATGEPPTRAEIVATLRAKIAHWDSLGFGLWLVRDRESGQMVGQGGLQSTFVAACNQVEVTWAIVPERWGQGLATELARGARKVALEDLGLDQIVAFTLPDNHASRRVMDKSGFVFEGEILHAGLPHLLYRCRAPGP
ncbi:MAG: GNAT family N-acetyltransferase [Solirubrobacteraceae bacterium]